MMIAVAACAAKKGQRRQKIKANSAHAAFQHGTPRNVCIFYTIISEIAIHSKYIWEKAEIVTVAIYCDRRGHAGPRDSACEKAKLF
jgi:hypothetical protein